jgi:phosphoglycolate phosphatase
MERRASLFDADGMLIRSQHAFDKATIQVAREMDIPVTEELLRKFAGKAPSEWLPELGVAGERMKQFRDRARVLIPDLVEQEVEWIEGVPEMLEELARKDHLLGIVTKAGRPTVHAVQRKLKWFEHFNSGWVVNGDDVKGRYKPEPDGLIEVAERMGVPKEICTFSGDHGSDVEAAARANYRASILYLGEHTNREEGAKATYVAETIGDVRDLLLKI